MDPPVMPRVLKLSGEPSDTQPAASEIVSDFRVRLGKEVGVAPERLCLLNGKAPVSRSLCLSELGEKDLQLIILAEGETVLGWTTRSLLNALCSPGATGSDEPNVQERFAAIEIDEEQELHTAVRIAALRACEELESSKICCDVIHALKERWVEVPKFMEDGSPAKHPVTEALHEFIKSDFECLAKSPEPPEEMKESMTQKQVKKFRAEGVEKARALVKLIGNLYITKELLDSQTVGYILSVLLTEGATGDHQAECVCDLIQMIGPAVESKPKGRMMMNMILDRLINLMRWGGAEMFSFSVQQRIEQVLEQKRDNWGRPVAGFA
eukprot:gnl/TRDRNA2_/TRDRNA2_80709_c0_seq1.p1 gnl/TRDRNA2_/TRDRNA2_80709_c0~~gnl/TRDRNA2_/TRDRNA2_80709_c0_seq1.p1  ORF type:complete len:324 (-),score=85.24 gnl/TRDRNA2_/TRDRNA2_80709_c0_seq1:60-1031(-)